MELKDYKEAAQRMLRVYGQGAQDRARKRARDLRAQGDKEGYSLWMGVYQAIEQLRFCGRLPSI